MQQNADEISTNHGATDAGTTPAITTATHICAEPTEVQQVDIASLRSSLHTESRYIRLPDVLYNLRHRYPTVTESVFLECTRCHQWVAVPVLRQVPDEVAEGAVAQSAQGLDSLEERTSAHGPLRHTNQDHLHRREQLALESTTTQWRSQRLQEKKSQKHSISGNAGPSSSCNSGGGGSTYAAERDDFTHAGGGACTSAPSPPQSTFEQILQQLRRERRRVATEKTRETTEPSNSSALASAAPPHQRYPLLYIPNPDTFVCAGWQCAWDADALADLRREWMDSLYKALPMPAVLENTLAFSATSSLSSAPAPTSPAMATQELQQRRRLALNEALAEELHVNRSRRPGRGYGGHLSHYDKQNIRENCLPSLSLSTQPLPKNSQAETATTTRHTSSSGAITTSTSTTECQMQLSRMQQSWVKAAALHLLRNGGGNSSGDGINVKEEGEAEGIARSRPLYAPASPLSTAAMEEANIGPLLSAYCWVVCDACGKLRRVAQPFPGGAPFVCAMAVTASSSCRAARPATATVTQSNKENHSSAVSVPAGVDNACSVSEVEGLIQCTIKLSEAELIAAALSSPFLPYPLKAQLTSLSITNNSSSWGVGGFVNQGKEPATESAGEPLSRTDVARVLLAEPLLRTIQSSVTEAIVKATTSPTSPGGNDGSGRRTPSSKGRQTTHQGTPTTNPSPKSLDGNKGTVREGGNGDDAQSDLNAATVFLHRSLPILRELARAIKKRGLASLVRQIQLTPAQIQAKREAVLRSSLLSGYQPSSTSTNSKNAEEAASAEQKKEIKQEPNEAAESCVDVTVVDGSATRSRTRGCVAPTVTAPTYTAANKTHSQNSPAAVGTKTTHPTSANTKTSSRHGRHPLEPQPQLPPVEKRKRGRPPTRHLTTQNNDTKSTADATTAETTTARDEIGGAPAHKRARRALSHTDGTTTDSKTSEIVTMASEVQQQPRRGVGRPRGRPPIVKKDADKAKETEKAAKAAVAEDAKAEGEEENDEEDDTWEVVHWVQCDRCSKWRIVPQRVPSSIKFWECKMRYDEERGRQTTCEDPDDADLSA